MRKRDIILVEQADIDGANKHRTQGGYHPPDHCPIARAVKRQRPELRGVKVNGASIREVTNGGVYINLPDVARQFVHRFDTRLPVKPFSFPIEWDE